MKGTSIFSHEQQIDINSDSTGQIFDAIIIPGIPFDNGKWGYVMKERVYWSYYLYSKGIAKNVIYSGSDVYTPYVEGKIMALYGEALGIKRENIFIEDSAEHSTENVYYSYKIAKRLHFKKIALATESFQADKLVSFIKKHRFKIELISINYDTLHAMQMTDPEIDYKQAYVKSFVSITERESLWHRLRGTIGWNVKNDADGR